MKLGDLPLSDGLVFPEDVDKPEPRFPLDVVFCPDCTLVQILETVSPDVLFSDDYPYFSSFSDALLEHSRRNVEPGRTSSTWTRKPGRRAGEQRRLPAPVLRRARHPVLGIDPAEGPVEAALARGIPTLHRFFGSDVAELAARRASGPTSSTRTTCSPTSPTPNGFVPGSRTLLADDGVAVIEVPYVKELIDHCEFDTIYHEHLCYFSVHALAPCSGVTALAQPTSSRSRSTADRCASSSQPQTADATVRAVLDEEARRAHAHRLLPRLLGARRRGARQLRRSCSGSRRGQAPRRYGAAAKGAILLNYAGIDAELLDCVADRNVHKQGRLMPGVHIPIVPPAKLLEDMPDYVLILPWNFKDEIMSQQAEYRRPRRAVHRPDSHPESSRRSECLT